MLFSKDMTDFEKLQFTEDYIKVLRAALEEKERNERSYKKNIHELIELFRKVSPKFSKVFSYRREMDSHREQSRKANRQVEKFEKKNFQLREKIRGLEKVIKEQKEIGYGQPSDTVLAGE